jgi:predicted dienelactone hydrolase
VSIVRTLFVATSFEGSGTPYDTLQLSVLYPAKLTRSDRERFHGVVDADPAGAPYPVVIFLNGVNCDPQRYQWLLLDVVRSGYVAVTVSWVAETLPGVVALTPGMDLRFCRPDTYGTGPTASAVAPVLRALEQLRDAEGPLAGMLDLTRVALGGHSGGGSVALHSADARYFANVRGVFAYGAHTGASTQLGFAADTYLPVSPDMPILLLGGSEDGVIVSSAIRYGTESQPDTPLRRTFERAIWGTRGDRYLAIVRGANHFTVVHPADPTAGRAFLDRPAIGDEDELRRVIADAVCAFLDGHVRLHSERKHALERILSGPNFAAFERK